MDEDRGLAGSAWLSQPSHLDLIDDGDGDEQHSADELLAQIARDNNSLQQPASMCKLGTSPADVLLAIREETFFCSSEDEGSQAVLDMLPE